MRWALSPVVGTGTPDDPYRLKIADYGDHVALIPGAVDGTPLFNWGLGRIADDVADTADADPQIAVFPAFSLDHVLTLAQRDWLIARLDARSLPAGWVVDGLTVRQALRTIGRWIEANFEIDWIGRL